MVFQRGEVVLLPFPFSDLSASKVRPAIVLSTSAYQQSEPDLLVAAVTSQVSAAQGPFDYVLADWQSAGLRFPSALKPVLATIDPSRVLHSVGSLSAADLHEVDARLARALGL
jgi:mRNA-degrading endonuclease toxin of MazEF toxin-antitoxin module